MEARKSTAGVEGDEEDERERRPERELWFALAP